MESTAIWIYFGIGCGALALALISFLLGEFTDVVGDWLGDVLHLGDQSFETPKMLNAGSSLGFLAGFGFSGAITIAAFDTNAWVGAGGGIIGGTILGLVLGGFWYLLRRSEGTSGYTASQLTGLSGTVTESIRRDGVGKVQCEINGLPVWHTARSEGGEQIAKGQNVTVTRAVGSTLFVSTKTTDEKGGI